MPLAVRPALDWARVGALLSIATSLFGLAVSVGLTVLKFMSDCRCAGTLLNACHDALARVSPALQGMFDCTAAFDSPYAAVLGLPLTVYATALYAVTLVLALLAARGGPTAARAAVWLLLAAILDVTASGVLFAISSWVLAAWCLFCFCLYFISASLLASALIACHRRPRTRSDLAPGLPVLLLVFGLAVVAVQAVPYGHTCDLPEQGCLRAIDPPPATRLALGAAEPDVLITVVFDPTCSACAREFTALQTLVADDPGIAARFLHYPREFGGCGFADVQLPAPAIAAVNAHACDLTFAVECIADRPGAGADDGLRALGDAFGALDVRPASARLAAVAAPFLSDSFTRKDLDRCLRARTGALAERVGAHLRYGVALDVRHTPTLVVAPVRAGEPQWHLAQVLPGRGDERLRKAIDRARRWAAQPQP
ncbi:vitamin K epoxide reductase family protein [Nannocystis radixulma]|uniref:Vitamin K epoxide reductase family protein n=1 Tax=Nannocystis radixulma TaxID=2995305 RepID=A0ABT5B588_9BACT|nr:vitamin K epoxide reductase family protein [Nannocystis radixulma]MDC0669257.1 vitamin K epoxide reductase family protein [Nannocystis radixulma]